MTNLDVFNTILAVASFLLAVIVSYGRLKVLAFRATKSSASGLRNWANRLSDQTAFLAGNPSAFVAYCVKRLILAIGALFLIPYFAYLARTNPWDLPLWLASALGKAMPIMCGATMGLLMVRADDVLGHLKRSARGV